jgi:hypothetical protein
MQRKKKGKIPLPRHERRTGVHVIGTMTGPPFRK